MHFLHTQQQSVVIKKTGTFYAQLCHSSDAAEHEPMAIHMCCRYRHKILRPLATPKIIGLDCQTALNYASRLARVSRLLGTISPLSLLYTIWTQTLADPGGAFRAAAPPPKP